MTSGKNDHPPIVGSFGSVLREARLAAGLTQAKLADRAGMSTRYVILLEQGQYQASITTLHDIARALDLSLAELMARVEAALGQGRG
ncbi:helix-turn-helix domain-containing protein [Falsirhodobacter halotolerans]|uniref:helix-turn-helix domain-containing protein n=1 Tax=Falsirhodobacter halotolerans TaxID=1146892 RepID=UPI001FD0C829|nr:helix-turn-helix domain-containing protein [Falsirhodobacter halotolerans]